MLDASALSNPQEASEKLQLEIFSFAVSCLYPLAPLVCEQPVPGDMRDGI